MTSFNSGQPLGIAGRIAAFFLKSPLTPLLSIGAVLLGVFALVVTPREEEPTSNVTLATITIPFPGASVKQVEQMVAIPAEQFLSQISGVEHITSVSRPGVAMMTVQFEVGMPRNDALVRLHEVIQSNRDWLPTGVGVGEPIVKAKGIDDVPMLTLTLFSKQPGIGAEELERIAHSLEIEVKQIGGTREVTTIGGPGRRVGIDLDSERMRSAGITVGDIRQALQAANVALPAGDLISGNRSIAIDAGTLLGDTRRLAELVVGMHQGRPVLLGQVASIDNTPPPERYVWHGVPGVKGDMGLEYPAVTLQVTKKPGTDASLIGFEIKRKVDSLKNTLIPPGVEVAVTRDIGAVGVDKALRLIYKLLFALVAVVALVWLMLSWREAFMVGVAITLTLLLTLFATWVIGYTLNRVSLFALIFAIGILVDDAIVVAENIHRHMRLKPDTSMRDIIPVAVDEVGGPTILATFAVIASLLPILNIRGMNAPYTHPVGITPSVGMLLSLVVAFIVTPWMARWCLKPAPHADTLAGKAGPILRKFSRPFLNEPGGRRNRHLLFAAMPLLLAVSMLPLLTGMVTVRTMPFENKTDFQVVVDMPPDTPVERTAALLRDLAQYMAGVPEVRDYQAYAGLSAPIDLVGLVRQYYLRNSGEYGTLQVNLLDRHARKATSHDVATRVRPELHKIAAPYGAVLRVVEPSAGPPALASLLAEIYGPDENERLRIAREAKLLFEATPDVVDAIDSTVAAASKRELIIDQRKAASLGITQETIVSTLRAGLGGDDSTYLHDTSKYPAPLRLQLAPAERSTLDNLLRLTVRATDGSLVPIGELVTVHELEREQPIYRKDLRPVVFVGAEGGGKTDSPLYPMLALREKLQTIKTPSGVPMEEHWLLPPSDSQSRFSYKWDGEWANTFDFFSDVGVAYIIAMILIYLLIVAHFGSYLVPLIIMAPIPLTLIGVIPGHLITGAQFSAASAVGIMALAGIIVRNAILLVDFIRIETGNGKPLREAVVDAPLVRAQPILLTALAAMLSGYFILGEQLFDGLGTGLIFGVLVSTLLTLVLIPLLYYHVYRKKIP